MSRVEFLCKECGRWHPRLRDLSETDEKYLLHHRILANRKRYQQIAELRDEHHKYIRDKALDDWFEKQLRQ